MRPMLGMTEHKQVPPPGEEPNTELEDGVERSRAWSDSAM